MNQLFSKTIPAWFHKSSSVTNDTAYIYILFWSGMVFRSYNLGCKYGQKFLDMVEEVMGSISTVNNKLSLLYFQILYHFRMAQL